MSNETEGTSIITTKYLLCPYSVCGSALARRYREKESFALVQAEFCFSPYCNTRKPLQVVTDIKADYRAVHMVRGPKMPERNS